MDLEIIIAFRIHIDFSKIGFYMFKVDIDLNNFDKVENIIKYIISNPNFEFICKTIGYVDLEFALILNNSQQLHQIMEDLMDRFPNALKNYSYFSEIKTFKDYEL